MTSAGAFCIASGIALGGYFVALGLDALATAVVKHGELTRPPKPPVPPATPERP